MDFALFNYTGVLLLLRWLHIFFGIIWIGHLYYFNFVQGSFFAETDATTKNNATQKLVPRALWWFRWGAMWTVVTGWTYIAMRGHNEGAALFQSSWGITILTGAVLGTFMWYNVWFVIWPKQKIVIESATLVAQGKQALAEAAGAGARSGVASRTNTLFSIGLLFFMASASHLGINVDPYTYKFGLYILLAGIVIVGLEANALFGKPGPMTTVKGVITSGFALTAILYVIVEICK